MGEAFTKSAGKKTDAGKRSDDDVDVNQKVCFFTCMAAMLGRNGLKRESCENSCGWSSDHE